MQHPSPLVFEKIGNDLGGAGFQSINPSASWLSSLIPFTYQRCADGDTWACTNFSLQDAVQILAKFQYGEIPDMSVAFSATDSGTKAGIGNSFAAADHSLISHWSCTFVDKPFTPRVTTLADFYAPNTTLQGQSAASQLTQWSLAVADLPDNSSASILAGLQISPVRVGVDGNYANVGNGIIGNNATPIYDHAVAIIGQRPTDGAWEVYDSESVAIVYFAADYKFEGGFVYQLKKTLPDFIKVGASILYLAKSGQFAGEYVGCGNGDTMLSIWGDYRGPERVELATFPANYKGHNLVIS